MTLVGLLTLFACSEDVEVVYAQFNADTDVVTVQVGVEQTTEPVEIALHSTTGTVEIGTALIDPGGGPIGTEHVVIVEVSDDWENQVVRATVSADAGDRGEDEYTMEPDSADEGMYQLTLVSVGEEGEVRDDILTIRLWEEDLSEQDDEDTGQ